MFQEHHILEILERIENQITLQDKRAWEQNHEIARILRKIERTLSNLTPHLSNIKIAFTNPKGASPMAVQGPVTLTSAGQVATASVLGFDQFGNPMPSTFVMPAVIYSIDDIISAIVRSTDNGDGTDTVTAVANGVANLTATVVSAEGLQLSDTETITVAIPTVPPVLSSIKIAFS